MEVFFGLSQLVEFGPAIAGLEDLNTEKIFVFIQARLFLKEHVQNLWYLWSKLHFEYRTWEQLGGHSIESLWVFKPKQRLGPREPPLGTLVLERLIRKAHAQEMAPSDSLTHVRHRTKIYNQDWSSVAMNKIRFHWFHPKFPHLSWKFWPVYQCWIHSLYCFWRSTVDIAALENHRIGGGFLYKKGASPKSSNIYPIFIQYVSNIYWYDHQMLKNTNRNTHPLWQVLDIWTHSGYWSKLWDLGKDHTAVKNTRYLVGIGYVPYGIIYYI